MELLSIFCSDSHVNEIWFPLFLLVLVQNKKDKPFAKCIQVKCFWHAVTPDDWKKEWHRRRSFQHIHQWQQNHGQCEELWVQSNFLCVFQRDRGREMERESVWCRQGWLTLTYPLTTGITPPAWCDPARSVFYVPPVRLRKCFSLTLALSLSSVCVSMCVCVGTWLTNEAEFLCPD